ncbi:hypothetical protein HFO61_30590 [Rhizobium leguminosarum]|uniref:hypothetical protein n=1 Tax=Rhizobium leguminosarum TaxID=384 RepID=UPI001C97F428|nr:hypothetical protein [Rhizobium leguminosarum]MBY5551095.1 hypothetical protein [Rhizobium leguminosarum]
MTTTSLVLSKEQHEVLNKITGKNKMEGNGGPITVSALVRELVDKEMPAFKRLLEAR